MPRLFPWPSGDPPALPETTPHDALRRPDNAPVDGARSPLVRPYLVAYEREERRTALAPGGADSGPWLLHGPYAGTSAVKAA